MTTTHNPATMLSSATESGAFDGILAAFASYGQAIVQQPVLSTAGAVAVAAVMAGAWILTREPIKARNATSKASEATTRAVDAIRKPGSLTEEAVHAAHARAEDQRANAAVQAKSESEAVLARLRSMRKPANSLSLLPLPDVSEGDPTQPAPFRR